MTTSGIPSVRGGDRLLVLAPHPDDETLATGELIQLAAEAGASVRVVFATDGDNNPWPQRWIERRIHIGAGDRARWGARRRAEALEALAVLGVPAQNVRFLGWPDLGLTDQLFAGDAAIATLADEFATYAPTHVAMPSLRDRHPDHGALRVMAELALEAVGAAPTRLGYVVHGGAPGADGRRMPDDARRHERKCAALLAHATQTHLSRRRLIGWARRPETFEIEADGRPAAVPVTACVQRVPLPPLRKRWRAHELLLVWREAEAVRRLRIPLRDLLQQRAGADIRRAGIAIAADADGVRITFAPTRDGCPRGYVKLERAWPRLLIFDTSAWHRLDGADESENAAYATMPPGRVAQRASI